MRLEVAEHGCGRVSCWLTKDVERVLRIVEIVAQRPGAVD
jgi:hypothetical protein